MLSKHIVWWSEFKKINFNICSTTGPILSVSFFCAAYRIVAAAYFLLQLSPGYMYEILLSATRVIHNPRRVLRPRPSVTDQRKVTTRHCSFFTLNVTYILNVKICLVQMRFLKRCLFSFATGSTVSGSVEFLPLRHKSRKYSETENHLTWFSPAARALWTLWGAQPTVWEPPSWTAACMGEAFKF